MVSIEFVLDSESLNEDLAVLSDTTPEAAIQETFFLMPVRFIIDGTDMFLQPAKNKPTFISSEEGETKLISTEQFEPVRLPLLDLATQGFQAVKLLSENIHQA